MPKISEFNGIKIFMYWNDNEQHHLPHFHAEIGEHTSSYELNGELLEGEMPRTKNILIRNWCLVRFALLQYAWDCAKAKKEIPWIRPL
jgi:hypothetical protein